MISLLKADLRRIFKDRLLLIMGILAVTFAIVTPLLYAAILAGTNAVQINAVSDALSGFFSGKTQFFDSFSIGSNMGLIAPVFIVIVMCKDFSYGTVRNKIISGKSRTKIFISLFISCSVVFTAVMMLHALVTLGMSLLFFDYQSTAFTASDFGYLLESLGFEILVLLCVSAIMSWLCASKKNAGLVIVLYVALVFGLVMAGSIIQVVLNVIKNAGGDDTSIYKMLYFIDRINIGSSSAYIGNGTEYTLKDVLFLTITPIAGILGFTGLGLLKFNKKDIK